MAAASRVRSTVALLGMFALVGNLLVGALLHSGLAQASAPSAQASVSPDTSTIVDPVLGAVSICHSGEVLTADSEPPSGDPRGAGHCPACTLIAKNAVAVALSFQPIVFTAAQLPPQSAARAQPLADHLGAGSIRSRAPPTSA